MFTFFVERSNPVESSSNRTRDNFFKSNRAAISHVSRLRKRPIPAEKNKLNKISALVSSGLVSSWGCVPLNLYLLPFESHFNLFDQFGWTFLNVIWIFDELQP
jgi:hypothetical protein